MNSDLIYDLINKIFTFISTINNQIVINKTEISNSINNLSTTVINNINTKSI